MPYWVYGQDASTGQPSDPYFCDADSEDAAREQATGAGITVEEVEYVEIRSDALESGTVATPAQLRTGIFSGSAQGVGQSTRGLNWLIAGVILMAISYIVSLAVNDYIMGGTVQQAFVRGHRLSWLRELTRIGLFAGTAASAAGGIMWIVDTSPNRGNCS